MNQSWPVLNILDVGYPVAEDKTDENNNYEKVQRSVQTANRHQIRKRSEHAGAAKQVWHHWHRDHWTVGGMNCEAMLGWIEIELEDGGEIPEPRPVDDYSGKFVTRVPRSLYRGLGKTAEKDGVSLNSFVIMAVARSIGFR